MTFATMPWWGDMLAFGFMGTFFAAVFAITPVLMMGEIVVFKEPNVKKWEEWIYAGMMVVAVVGGYMTAFAILAGWW